MKKRPVIISILALLQITIGFVAFNIFGFIIGAPETTIPPLLAITGILIALLAFISGLGMWLGKAWGWWLGAFFALLTGLRYLIGAISPQYAALIGVPKTQSLNLIRGLFFLLICLYFFKDQVKSYFGVFPASKD